jgi:hypothetical protein
MRVGRRGFLTYSLIFAAACALLLWEFQAHASSASDKDSSQVSAAVLLLTPTLLGLFLFRPGEHELAARLLSGIRGLVVCSGLLCVAAAMALIGAMPPGVNGVAGCWRLYGILATAVVVVLGVSWVLSFNSFERLRKVSAEGLYRYRAYMTASFLLQLGVLLVVLGSPQDAGSGDLRHDLIASLMCLLAAAGGWVAQFADVNYANDGLLRRRRWAATALGLSAFALVAVVPSLGDLDGSADTWRVARTVALVFAGAGFALHIVLEISRRFGWGVETEPQPGDDVADHLD